MGKLTDLLDSLADMDEKPDTMLDDLRAAHAFDMDEANAASAAAQAAAIEADANSQAAIAERDASIAELKARNYDLVRALPTGDNNGGGMNDDEVDEGDVLENPEQATIDDLFTERA